MLQLQSGRDPDTDVMVPVMAQSETELCALAYSDKLDATATK